MILMRLVSFVEFCLCRLLFDSRYSEMMCILSLLY